MPFQGNVMRAIDTVIFDIGNVLIPWDPRWLLRKLLPDETALERFMSETGFIQWNAQHDAGQAFAQGIEKQGAAFPHYRHLFQAYFERWEETIAPPIQGCVSLARKLRTAGYRTLALTNFSAETFPRAIRLNPFLSEFEGIVVSGEEEMMKPETAIYTLLCDRYAIQPARAVFIDDSLHNVEGARHIGMHAVHFKTVEQLHEDLHALGITV